jgi:hypothetical protein
VTEEYTGSVVWKLETGEAEFTGMPGNLFQPEEIYRAEVSLYAAPGYVFGEGLTPVYHEGKGTMLSTGEWNNKGSSITGIRIGFVATDPITVTDLDLTPYISKPVKGRTPKTDFSEAVQYDMVTVEWREGTKLDPLDEDAVFKVGTGYTATVELTARKGRSFEGVMRNAFTHAGAKATPSNEANSGVVTIKFVETVGDITAPVTSSW